MADDDDRDEREDKDDDKDEYGDLPADVEDLIDKIEDDAKRLNRAEVDVRKYLRDYLVPRVATSVEVLGQGMQETYDMASEVLNQLISFRTIALRELKKLGVSIPDEELRSIAPDVDHITKLYEAIGGLGFILSQKLPQDEEVKGAHNHVVETFLRAFGTYVGEKAPPEEDGEDEPTPRKERQKRREPPPEVTDDRPPQ